MTSLLGRRFRLISDGNEGDYGYVIVGVDLTSCECVLLGEATNTNTLKWFGIDDVQIKPDSF